MKVAHCSTTAPTYTLPVGGLSVLAAPFEILPSGFGDTSSGLHLLVTSGPRGDFPPDLKKKHGRDARQRHSALKTPKDGAGKAKRTPG